MDIFSHIMIALGVGVLLMVAAMLLISWNNESRRRHFRKHITSFRVDSKLIKGKPGRVFILVPGILARSEQQFAPLIETLKQYGSIIHFDYQGKGFDLAVSAKTVAGIISGHTRANNVTVIGASLGGIVGYEAVKMLSEEDARCVSITMIDTPYGHETMAQFPSWLSWIFKLFPSSPLPEALGNFILMKGRQGPKVRNIELPAGVDKNAYIKQVQDTAMENLSGHSFLRYYEMLKALVTHVPKSGLGQVKATYVACISPENDVVEQPLAMEQWLLKIPAARPSIMEGATHCGFLEQAPSWQEHFNKLFAPATANH